jgi:hypothetical protein
MRIFTFFVVAIALIVLILVIIIKSITGGPTKPSINLNSYANTNAVAELLIDGPVSADQTHQQIDVKVSSTSTNFAILNGYQGQVATSKTFENNQAAFAVFLHSLNLAGFTKGNTDPSLSDYRGFCPDGDRYVLTLTEGSDVIQKFWATSCGGQGTYSGDTQQTLSLFQGQVPDYADLTANVVL